MCLRALKEIREGMSVNLGIGIPTLLGNLVPPDMEILLHAEIGALNYGGMPSNMEDLDGDLINASAEPITLKPGISFFDTALAFGMIRGGHIDLCVMGAYQVSEKGDLANHTREDQVVGTIGGAMDLVAGAKRIIVLTESVDKQGRPKIKKRCTLPLTGKRIVHTVITDLALLEVTLQGLLLKEIAPGVKPEEVQAVTEPKLIISRDLKEMEF